MGCLSGKVALVVGVANKRSLAWAIAQALHGEGASLVLTYQNERLRENVDELAATLSRAPILVPCDVSFDEEVNALFATVERECAGVDLLVHGAAFAPREALSSPFVETSRESFRVALDVSAYSLIALARAAAPSMARRGGGSILTLTYLGSERVFPNYNVMGVAKAALEASVRYLASDLGPHNIRVNAISAGPVRTLAASGVSGFTSILDVYRSRAPLRRNIEAAEVAEPALMLLGPAGRGITGTVLKVDCGYHTMGM
jgi:enoyl-[acyl-carrier protein] reductase I